MGKGEGRTDLVKGFEHHGHAGEVSDCIVQLLRLLDKVALQYLCGRDGGLDHLVVFLGRLLTERDVLNDVDDVPHARSSEAKFLLVETPVFDTGDEVVEALSLDDVIQNDFVAFFAESGEELGIFAFGYPEGVAQLERPLYYLDAFPGQFIFDVVSVCLGTDFSIVQDEFDGKGAWSDTQRLKGRKLVRLVILVNVHY